MTGLPAILMTGGLLLWLPSSPREARFLSTEEQDILLAAVDKGTAETATHGNPLAALWDARVIGFGLIYVLKSTALYRINYWLPTIVKGFDIGSTRNGLLNMIPWCLAVLLLLVLPRRLKGEHAVLTAISITALAGLLCFVSSVLFSINSALYKKVHVQFRAEMFNVLNHPNFAPPLANNAIAQGNTRQITRHNSIIGRSSWPCVRLGKLTTEKHFGREGTGSTCSLDQPPTLLD